MSIQYSPSFQNIQITKSNRKILIHTYQKLINEVFSLIWKYISEVEISCRNSLKN